MKDEIVRCKDCKHRPVKSKDYKGRSDLEFPDYKCPCQCDDFYYSWYPLMISFAPKVNAKKVGEVE